MSILRSTRRVSIPFAVILAALVILFALAIWLVLTAVLGVPDSPHSLTPPQSRESPGPRKSPQPPVPLVWELRSYTQDDRSFLAKFQELVASIEVFPLQWLAFPGAHGAYFEDSRYVAHADALRFYEFAQLARTASEEDLQDCAACLDGAPPKEQAMILVLLHLSLDDKWLPSIAKQVDNYGEPFPQPSRSSNQAPSWRPDPYSHPRAYHEHLSQIAQWKRASGQPLSAFDRRVEHFRRERWDHPHTNPEMRYGFTEIKCVSDYALAILTLRGCCLVNSMRQMLQLRSLNRPVQKEGLMDAFGDHETPLTVESVFGSMAWEEYRSMRFDVRRLRHEYILQVECVPPPDQEDAMAEFAERLKKIPTRTAALAISCIWPSIGDESLSQRHDFVVSDWPQYVRRIPKEQIREMLTSPNLDAVDADLTFEPQAEAYLGYRPYFNGFLVYVLQHRSEWFDDTEFAVIEPRLSSPAQRSWTTVKRLEARKRR